MKSDIHPAYAEVTAACSCGNVIKVRSTAGKSLNLDICSNCHPFYTGQKKEAVSGRVDKFKKRYAASGAKSA